MRHYAPGEEPAAYMLLAGRFVAASIEVLALDGDRVREITAFAGPAIFGPFGLPAALPAGG